MDPTTPAPVTEPVFPRSTVAARDDADRADPLDVTEADLQQLRWGPIFAGLLTAVGIFVLLTLPAIAVGLQAAPGVEKAEDMSFMAIHRHQRHRPGVVLHRGLRVVMVGRHLRSGTEPGQRLPRSGPCGWSP